jgi:hypothetical protein
MRLDGPREQVAAPVMGTSALSVSGTTVRRGWRGNVVRLGVIQSARLPASARCLLEKRQIGQAVITHLRPKTRCFGDLTLTLVWFPIASSTCLGRS